MRSLNQHGDVLFGAKVEVADASLLDFWKWAFSDLCDDDVKGIFAEWIILKLLKLPGTRRISWSNSDLRTPGGTTIEVKASSYWQSWKMLDGEGKPRATRNEPELSDDRIRFSGLMSRNSEELAERHEERALKSMLYVFAFQNEKHYEAWNAMNLEQWEFYVVPAEKIRYASISLKKLRSDFTKYDAATMATELRQLISSREKS